MASRRSAKKRKKKYSIKPTTWEKVKKGAITLDKFSQGLGRGLDRALGI